MSAEYDFLKDLDGRDPDGFAYSLDRRGILQRLKEFFSSFKKDSSIFLDLPHDFFDGEKSEEY